MELSKTEYASYSSPIVLVLGYFAGCGIGVAGIWILTEFLSGRSLGLGFFDGFLRVLIMLAGTAVFLSVHFLPTYILGYKSGKIYRGRGFYRFINTVCVLCPLAFLGVIFFYNQVGVSYGFLRTVCLSLSCAYPLAVRWLWYHKCFGVRKCSSCGLINTMKYGASKEKKIGTRYEFYEYATKGYVYEQTEKTTELVCSVCGGRDYDREEYDKRI